MEVKKTIIFTDENTIVIDKVLSMAIDADYKDMSECVFNLKLSYSHEDAKYIPNKVYILQKDDDELRIYDRYTEYDVNKCGNTFKYGDCPYINYTKTANIEDIIWYQNTLDKTYEKFKKDGVCICATKEIAEALKSIFEKKILDEYIAGVELEFAKLQEKFEEMKKHVI